MSTRGRCPLYPQKRTLKLSRAMSALCQKRTFRPLVVLSILCLGRRSSSRGITMKIPRRRFLHLAAGAATLPTSPRVATALDYPTRPVHLVVGYPPGGATDVVARLIGQALTERLNQQFVVDNRPGAGTTIATESVVRASADGYTLLAATTSNGINPSLYPELGYDFRRDMAMVAGLTRQPLVIDVYPDFPAKSVPELIAYAKAKPGQVSMGSFGTGTVSHVAGELFKMMAGIGLLHVPYRGTAPMLTDLLSGRVQIAFDVVPTSLELIRTGKLRGIAVTTAKRSEVLPDLPTVAEFLPGYEAASWIGMAAPGGTAVAIVDKLNHEISACLSGPELAARITQLGSTPFLRSPSEMTDFVGQETEKWARVVKFAGIKAD
jgi:tripartite-type tricarboxylate transporter receptor subunit TctC